MVAVTVHCTSGSMLGPGPISIFGWLLHACCIEYVNTRSQSVTAIWFPLLLRRFRNKWTYFTIENEKELGLCKSISRCICTTYKGPPDAATRDRSIRPKKTEWNILYRARIKGLNVHENFPCSLFLIQWFALKEQCTHDYFKLRFLELALNNLKVYRATKWH